MNTARNSLACLVALLAGTLALAAPALAAPETPAFKLALTSQPTNFAPGPGVISAGTPLPQYTFVATNVGSQPTAGPITVTDTLPTGLTPTEAGYKVGVNVQIAFGPCAVSGQTITCTVSKPLQPGQWLAIDIGVDVDPGLAEGSSILNQAEISGGGALPATVSTTTTISSTDPPFGFLDGAEGLNASLTETDGQPATQAGSHPYQLTIDLGLSTVKNGGGSSGGLTSTGGGVRDLRTALPRGLIVNPAATPVRCTEAQLESRAGGVNCPESSQVGTVSILTPTIGITPNQTALYNMVPPGGSPAELAFDAVGVGIFVHLLGGVRAGDYTLTAASDDILARSGNPILGIQAQLWGDPSSPSHDAVRGICEFLSCTVDSTPAVAHQTTPFLTMPSACGGSIGLGASADSWFDPGTFLSTSATVGDLLGNPTGVAGCDSLKFEPTLKARPTTNVADSPSGLEVDLDIPQTDELGTTATAHLRKAVVTLPEGLVINPSGANGLAGCSSAQVGIDPGSGVANGNEVACPSASKIGTVEVDTALLDHPLPGAVYVATPHDNPFDSLLAIYVVVDDPQSATLIKLAGHVVPDPRTGRLTTSFDENPQLPFSHFKLDFFPGAAAALRTPATCATYSTTSELTPWSAPESGPPATPSDSYSIDRAPGGGSCAKSAGALPNAPSFDAGSVSLIAGAYTPFVLNLRRADGTQQFSTIAMTPPPGLLGKLAGTPYCPEAALAAAAAKSGNQEKASPSCPAASQVGSADVGAGAGPAPYYAQGKAYLAGPYKGAPLSLAIVTPATAGPYDLGTVVVRTALNVDPETARITAVSDPIPQILQGIPLDVRSVAVKLDRPSFTLNPTSCDPFAVSGQLVSAEGNAAALQNPFQVAECGRLGFKPKLSLRLKGGTKRSQNPSLRAVLSYPEGTSANIAKASVALPHSEFLDQTHIRTICTRVQFAAGACPTAAIYGRAKAITPLLDAPLEGPVYLRSSSNPLPDLVADLNGQIHVVLVGRIDSVKGGIRTSFDSVPDAPVSKFVLEMQGGKKGLLENSTDLCRAVNRATALFDGQNGKAHDFRPPLRNSCGGKKHRGQRRSKG